MTRQRSWGRHEHHRWSLGPALLLRLPAQATEAVLRDVATGRPGEPAPGMFRASVTRELSRVEALLKVRM